MLIIRGCVRRRQAAAGGANIAGWFCRPPERHTVFPLLSFLRKQEGGLTFEVQRLEMGQEYLGRCFKAKAFSRGMIEAVSESLKVVVGEAVGVCAKRDVAA